jgi:hypothetical protein
MLANTAVIYHWRGDRLLAPGFAANTLARLRGAALDRRLAEGADASRSRLLAARAAQLGRRRTRHAIARGFESAALTPERHVRRFGMPPARAAARLNRDALLEVAEELRDPGVLYVSGIAAARALLTDGAGPLYTDRRGEALATALQEVRTLLASIR